MAIQTRQCYTITCDDCGSKLDWDYEPHFDSPEMARELASDAGEFWSDGATDLCSTCRLKPHKFVPEIAGRDDVACEQCGLDQDEHEPVAAAEVTR
ncbi:hypothetical protein ACGF5C_31745 [Micromonospora sp. NPDC047620]|uniref:hypothetical protein n=1 Tax=Micromonospora sp. NPDC047620 TaxID=3364251 RepID=UPI00371E93E4